MCVVTTTTLSMSSSSNTDLSCSLLREKLVSPIWCWPSYTVMRSRYRYTVMRSRYRYGQWLRDGISIRSIIPILFYMTSISIIFMVMPVKSE